MEIADAGEQKNKGENLTNAREVEVGTLVGSMDAKRGEILALFDKREEDDIDLDVQVVDAILEYLEGMKVLGVENLALLAYDEEELGNRNVTYEDELMALTLDDTDEESGEKTYGAWIKVK